MTPAHDAMTILHVRATVQVLALVLAVGWTAERIVDSGTRWWPAPILCGLAGLHLGPPLLGALGWQGGPSLWGHRLVPLVVGALAAAVLLKLVRLAVAGSRR